MESVPSDVQSLIIGYLSDCFSLFRAGSTCRRWRSLCALPHLWDAALSRELSSLTASEIFKFRASFESSRNMWMQLRLRGWLMVERDPPRCVPSGMNCGAVALLLCFAAPMLPENLLPNVLSRMPGHLITAGPLEPLSDPLEQLLQVAQHQCAYGGGHDEDAPHAELAADALAELEGPLSGGQCFSVDPDNWYTGTYWRDFLGLILVCLRRDGRAAAVLGCADTD